MRKFSQVGARISLENFITSLTQTPEWFADVDPAEEEIQKVFKTGYHLYRFCLPSEIFNKNDNLANKMDCESIITHCTDGSSLLGSLFATKCSR